MKFFYNYKKFNIKIFLIINMLNENKEVYNIGFENIIGELEKRSG